MKTKSKLKQIKRESLYKLLDSFEEKDFYAVKNFAEFIKTKNGKDSLEMILENADFDIEELNEETLQDIKKAQLEYGKGKVYSAEQIKKELGI
ncbi:MAG: hypothetical protein R3A12_19545 [Ignavibacteria bacterium]